VSSIILTALIVGVVVAVIRLLASFGVAWGFFPANTFGIVTTKANKSTDPDAVSGGVVDILHNIPGRYLDRSNRDKMEWEYKKEEEDRVESRGLLYHVIGVEYLGGVPFTRFLRTNKIHQIRPKKNEKDGDGTDYVPKSVDFETKFVYFSGNQTVLVTGAETAAIFGLDLNFNLVYERIQPLKSVLRVADIYAVLTLMVREAVIRITSTRDPEEFTSGDDAKDLQKALVTAVESINGIAKEELGIQITKATLESISVDEKTKGILELKEKTKRENEALVLTAEAKAKAQIAKNEADAHRVREVILPQANTPGAAAIRLAEAYENNDTVTVFAPGGNLSQIIPSVDGKKAKVGFSTDPAPSSEPPKKDKDKK